MTESWKGDFKRAVIDAVLRNGMKVKDVVMPRYDFSGWADYGDNNWAQGQSAALTQIEAEGIDYEATTYDDSEWYEFAGTFAEEPWTPIRGVDVVVKTLAGNTFRWRYDSSIGSLITEVLRDDT